MLFNCIHIFGASGSGTSTIGMELDHKMNYAHFDVDDYFWISTNPPFTVKRNREDRIKLLKNDISKKEKFVLTGSLCGWGDVFIPLFDIVIKVETPTEIRIERLKKREFARFGTRILCGGDMYDGHQKFLE